MPAKSPATQKAATRKPATRKAPADQRAAKKAAARTPSAKTPAAKAPKTPAAKKAAAKTPAAKTPSAKTPAAKAPKTPAAKKVVPKRSPSYGMSVDAWAQKLADWQRDVVMELVRAVTAAAPGVTVSVKWNQPVFELHGPFAFVKPASAHVTIGFWRGAELEDELGVLGGAGTRMRHLKIGRDGAIPITLIERFVRQAVRLNAQHGDPTRS